MFKLESKLKANLSKNNPILQNPRIFYKNNILTKIYIVTVIPSAAKFLLSERSAGKGWF